MTERTGARVLFVGAFPPPESTIVGGMVTSCRALLESSFPQRARLDLLDSTQVSNPIPPLFIRAVLASRRFCRYVVRFESRKPDCVLLFTAVGASVAEKGAMAWYARLRGVPALIFPRGGGLVDAYNSSRITAWGVRLAFRGARAVLCQSGKWQQFAVQKLGFRHGDAPIIQNWTASPELLRIGRARMRRDLGRPTGLVFVGWLDREKGVLELLQACARLAGTKSFTLDLVGEGNMSQQAREFVRSHALDGIVRFCGWLGPAELRDALARNDVLVLPSWAEGLPNAMIEGMSAGLAVVVSAVGSVPDYAVDDRNALLIPPRDVAALTSAIERLIDDGDLRHRIAVSGRTLAEREFGVERAAEALLVAIDRVTKLSGGSAHAEPHA